MKNLCSQLGVEALPFGQNRSTFEESRDAASHAVAADLLWLVPPAAEQVEATEVFIKLWHML